MGLFCYQNLSPVFASCGGACNLLRPHEREAQQSQQNSQLLPGCGGPNGSPNSDIWVQRRRSPRKITKGIRKMSLYAINAQRESQNKSFRSAVFDFHFPAHNNPSAAIPFPGFYFQVVRIEQILEYCRLSQERGKIT